MLALLGGMVLATWAYATSYVYDVNGRLIAVSNDSGESARYAYDVMGNLTQVERFAPGELALFGFNPNRGTPGTPVRLQGHGFSPVAADNLVRFNGVPTTVSAAGGNELMTSVPVGASTGPISITVGSQTVSSGTNFIVDEVSQLPVIHSVSPLIAAVGTMITATGESLNTVPGQTTVRLGMRAAQIGVASNNEVNFTVPANAASGKVSITTPYGTALSAEDVVVAPSGVGASSIVQNTRLLPGAAAAAFSVATTGEQVAVLFDAVSGEFLDAQFGDISVASIAYSLYGLDNRLLASGTVTPSNPTFLLPQLGASGTYLMLLKPVQGPATWKLAIERSRPVVLEGDSLMLATEVPAQRKRFIFSAEAGQRLGLGISDLTVSTGSYVSVYVYRPNGASLTSTTCYQSNSGCGLNLSAADTGTYSVVVTPQSATQTMQFKATLSSDKRAVFSRNTPLELVLDRRGQNARLTFTAEAGETLALQMAGQITVPAGRTVYYTVYKPDGSQLSSVGTSNYATLNLSSLPVAGEYQVFVDPSNGETASLQMTLATGTTSGTELDGEGGDFSTTLSGQSMYLTFSATAGQRLGLGISDLTVSTGSYVLVNVYRPTGASLTSVTCYQSNNGCGLNLLPAETGTYSVVITPSSATQTMQFKATLSSDIRGSLQRDVPMDLVLNRRGQNARITFTAEAGETLALQIAGQVTAPAGRTVYYTVYKPDGSQLSSTSTSNYTTLNLPSLLATGEYQVLVDPSYGEMASMQMTLATGTTSGTELDGEGGDFSTTLSGQPIYLTFPATAGQRLGLGISDLTVSTGSYVSVYVYRPNGANLTSATCFQSNGGCGLNLSAADTGTYSIVVTPQSATQTMQFKTTLSSDVRASLQRDVPMALVLNRRGQNARLTFTAEAGETLALQMAGQITVPAGRTVYYTVYKPDGSKLSSVDTSNYATLNLPSLPAKGEYQVFVDPLNGETESVQMTLATGTTSGTELDGEGGDFTTTMSGQPVYLTFPATAGQRLGLGISDLTVSTGSYVSVYIYRPNGANLTSATCFQSNGGCGLNLSAADTGTYSVVVTPQSATQTMQFKTTLSSDVRASLQRDVPMALVLNRRGQNARLTFTAEAGETLALQMAGQITVPSGRTVYYTVYKPDGSQLSSVGTSNYATLNLPSLPVAGEYQVFVDPNYGETASMQMTLATGTTSDTKIDGSAGDFSTTLSGQPVYLTFPATAGQRLGLGISDLTVSTGSYVSVYVYRPNGANLTSATCFQSNGGCGLNLSAADTGTYSIVVTPQSATQTMQFKTTLSSDVRTSLQRDVPMDLVLDRRGQNARLTFTAEVGETLALQTAGQSTVPTGQTVYYTVYKPDGSQLASTNTGSYTTLNLPNLPVAGEYQVFVDPSNGATSGMQVTLATGTIGGTEVDGGIGDFSTTLPGQPVYLTFPGEAGQQLGLGLSDLTVATGTYVNVTVYRPSGASLTSATCSQSNGGCGLNLSPAETGTYSVVVTPQSATQTMQFKTTLSSDMRKSLQRDVSMALALGRRGQNARLTFTAEAGETLALQMAGQATVPAGRTVYYIVYRPDGTQLQSSSTGGSNLIFNFASLPMAGEYQVFIDPGYGETLSGQVLLASGIRGIIGDEKEAAAYATTVSGQNVYLDFQATAGQRLGLGLSDLVMSNGGDLTIVVRRSSGASLLGVSFRTSTGAFEHNLTMPDTGAYYMEVSPGATQTMQFKATLSTDVEATLERNVPLAVSLPRRGQNGWYAFDATAGGSVALQVENQSSTPSGRVSRYDVYRPDGKYLSGTTTSSSTTFNLTNLPTTGTYHVLVDPFDGATLSATLTVK